MCTSIRFTDNSGHMYLGRNLDCSFDYGQQVRVCRCRVVDKRIRNVKPARYHANLLAAISTGALTTANRFA